METRLILDRRVGNNNCRLLWCLLNPSTADDSKDDPTIRRLKRFTADHGYGKLRVVNLYAVRATNPAEIKALPPSERIGFGNTCVLAAEFKRHDLFVAAWGAVPWARDHAAKILSLARTQGCVAHSLGVTRNGAPMHPLYRPADAVILRYYPSVEGYIDA